ncbi:MAG: hypothetical protein IKT23_08505 [Clostridia bacterium]|nr:hypothetical protein [Clostridia bacterium]
MDIIEIKRKLAELDEHGSDWDVYGFLRSVWNERKDTAVAFLVVSEMVELLLWIESTAPDVQENEDGLYRGFFEEAAEFGYKNCLNDKLFLWQMARYCYGNGTFYYIHYTSFCKNCTADEAYERLMAIADNLYPKSMMFKLIPSVSSANWTWVDRLTASECRLLYDELQELNLQNNYSDDQIKDYFMMEKLKEKLFNNQ